MIVDKNKIIVVIISYSLNKNPLVSMTGLILSTTKASGIFKNEYTTSPSSEVLTSR